MSALLSGLSYALLKVTSGDTYSANAKNCAQFFTPSPQKLRLSEFSAGHASQEVA